MKIIKIKESELKEVISKILNEQVSGAPLLRKLSRKSKMNFGKFSDLTVQEILNLDRKAYLRKIYYNIEGISFLDDILEELRIKGEDFDYTIQKPGKNPELGEELDEKIYKNLPLKIKSHLGKRGRGEAMSKLINKRNIDRINFSKGNLQRINQGRKN